jgi:cellulose synthase operon protein YhjU
MRYWSLYFFAKLLLYAGGHIGFHAWANFAFAVYTALPARNARLRLAKNLLGVPVALLLLYYDSWLPPLARVLTQAPNVASFTPSYLVELAARFIDPKVVAELAVLLAIYLLARRKLRLGSFALVAILVAAIAPQPGAARAPAQVRATGGAEVGAMTVEEADPRYLRTEALDALLAQFYQREAGEQVRLPQVATDPAYDVLLVHVCSLSWDDLEASGLMDQPLLQRFDVLLTRFNSAASYSGPAAIRLLRGNCGQTPHKQLYDAPEARCLLVDGLQRAGFEPHWLMNHDGHFGNFYADVRDRGGMPVVPDSNAGATVTLRAFDGTPVLGDYSVLSRWWKERLAQHAPRIVLYYNTISLHDGNHAADRAAGPAASTFTARARRLFADLGEFIDDVTRSGRRVVLVLVPEHGAAVRGDRRQIPGLREIPTPGIALVPVGIALIGPDATGRPAQVTVDVPTSYLALSELLSRLVTDNPFAGERRGGPSYAQNLPPTSFVAENEGTVVVQIGAQFMLRTADDAWSPWDVAR